jgi:hypothetical protein
MPSERQQRSREDFTRLSLNCSNSRAAYSRWFSYLPEHHSIYFQFNLVINGEGETLADFAGRLATALEQPDVRRLVIDLRNNTGGDNTLLRPLLVALIRSKVNVRGGIFAIVGPTTFSRLRIS